MMKIIERLKNRRILKHPSGKLFLKKYYIERNRGLIKNNLITRGLVLRLSGRIKGVSRTRMIELKKGSIGSLGVSSSSSAIRTKFGILNLTISRGRRK